MVTTSLGILSDTEARNGRAKSLMALEQARFTYPRNIAVDGAATFSLWTAT
jgi:hypothetical protein